MHWREPTEALVAQVMKFGAEVETNVGLTYISLLRRGKKFAILQPSSAARLDPGIKRKRIEAEGRYELAGSWNAMVTHRVMITDPAQLDRDILQWLRNAYDAAG